MLKHLIYILFLTEFCQASIFVTRVCDDDGDCFAEECCLQRPFSTTFYCAKRVDEGKVCWHGLHNVTDKGDKFKYICPCRSYLECRYLEKIPNKPVIAVARCRLRVVTVAAP